MDANNIAQQLDELEVLVSIFGDQWKRCDNIDNTYSIKLTKDVELWITLNELYPSHRPPQYELWAPNLTRSQKDFIDKEFNDIYQNDKGFPIIFQWIEKLKDIMNGKIATDKEKNELICDNNVINQQVELLEAQTKPVQLEITHGSTITDRKSTFQGHVCKVTEAAQVSQFLEQLLDNKKIREATHNILAYRIISDKNLLLQDCEDDGETHAGGRLLHLLEILDMKNMAVVVTRWYGGIHLGPDRFKHINNAARQVLMEAGFIK